MARKLLNSTKLFYNNFLNRRPYLTQSIQVAAFMGAGDFIAQHLIEKVPLNKFDLKRTGIFMGIGFVMIGPSLRWWFGTLDKLYGHHKNPWKKTLLKVSTDQLLWAPCFNLAFVTVLSAAQGMKPDKIKQRLHTDYLTILKTNYMIWPAAQLINFSLIPLNYQVVFVQLVALFWNTYLSLTLGAKKED